MVYCHYLVKDTNKHALYKLFAIHYVSGPDYSRMGDFSRECGVALVIPRLDVRKSDIIRITLQL